jgi:phage terminase small subunit
MVENKAYRKGLSLKQLRFAEAYVQNGGIGTKAALAVYDTTSYNCANQIAMDNLRNPTVVQYINKLLGPIEVSHKELAQVLVDSLPSETFYERRWAWEIIMRLKDLSFFS